MSLPKGLVTDQTLEDLIDLSDKVGRGTTREVFGVKGAPDFVIKECYKPFHHGNFVEWTVWHAIVEMAEDIMGNETNSQLQEVFAEAVAISHSAKFLLMERLLPLKEINQAQLRVFPEWLNDRKPSAFGLTKDGQIKVMDYAMVNFYHALNPLNKSSIF